MYVCSAAVVAFVRVYACNGALRRLLLLRRTMKHGKRAFFRLCQCVFGSRSGQIDAKITRTPNTDERRSQPELKRVRNSIKGCRFRFTESILLTAGLFRIDLVSFDPELMIESLLTVKNARVTIAFTTTLILLAGTTH